MNSNPMTIASCRMWETRPHAIGAQRLMSEMTRRLMRPRRASRSNDRPLLRRGPEIGLERENYVEDDVYAGRRLKLHFRLTKCLTVKPEITSSRQRRDAHDQCPG